MKYIVLFFVGCILSIVAMAQNTAPAEVVVGSQIWMKADLTATSYRNGDKITHAETPEQWERCSSEHKGCWCTYNNRQGGSILYNYYAVTDKRGLAPAGWHIPSGDEMKQLVDATGGPERCGDALKARNDGQLNPLSTEWNGTGNGCRYFNGAFNYEGLIGYWWTATPATDADAVAFCLYNKESNSSVKPFMKGFGFAVRCVKSN